MRKYEIFDELTNVIGLLDLCDYDAVRIKIMDIRSSLVKDIAKGEGALATEFEIRTIVNELVKRHGRVYKICNRYCYLDGCCVIALNNNITDFKVMDEDDKDTVFGAVKSLINTDYTLPHTTQLKVPSMDELNLLTSAYSKVRKDNLLYQFSNGPMIKVNYLEMAIKVTGARCAYTIPVRSKNGVKYTHPIYLHGDESDVYVMPFAMEGSRKVGVYYRHDLDL